MAVQTSLALQDRLTGPLTRMMRSMDNTIRVMERMDSSANSIDTRALSRARREIDNASADMARLNSAAGSAGQGIQQFTQHANRGENATRSFGRSILGLAAAYLSVRALASGFSSLATASDEYTSTSARLNLINDGLQTQVELQDKIFAAAQRSRSAYGDMADSVAKLNLLAGDAFNNNDEAIKFSELMGKAFTVSGAGTSERSAGMHQLTQAMAAGKLQGDEFTSINENAPLLAQAIADAMNVSKGELKKLSSEGKITADIIKAALFRAGDDIEDKFKTMPVTFGQAMTMLKNEGLRAFQPLLVKFSEFVNSDAFAKLTEQAMVFLTVSATALGYLFDAIVWVTTALSAIADYWPVIAAGLGIIIAIYLPAMLSALWAMITPILVQAAAWAVAYWPILLIIGAVIGLIAILMHFGVTTEQIMGFVGGLLFGLGAVIWNLIANAWNIFAMFAEFLINLFIDPVYAVKKLFYDLMKMVIDNMAAMAGSFDTVADVLGKAFVAGANIAIGGINMLIKALNMIPGVDIGEIGKVSADTSSIISGGLKNMANNLTAPTSDKNVVSLARMDLKSVPGAVKNGITKGSNMKMPSLSGGAGALGAMPNADMGKLLGAGDGKVKGGKLDSVGKIDDEISIADEDLKMLKELADIRSIQNFQTLQPSFTFGDMTIREDADITKIIAGIETYMKNEMDRSTEGVYA